MSLGTDPQHVWKNHKEDKASLENYAEAMKELATKHWQTAKGKNSISHGLANM